MNHKLLSIFCFIILVDAAAGQVLRTAARVGQKSSQQDNTGGSISTPVLGLFTSDGGTEVRTITGVPGAALVGDTITLPDQAGRIWLAPAQDWAIVEKADKSGFAVLPFRGVVAGTLDEIDGSVSTADSLAFAPREAIAAVHSKVSERLQIIVNGQVATETSTAGRFSSPIVKIAIDDSGLWPIVATEDGDVYAMRNDAPPQLLYRGAAISDIAFVAGKRKLILADAGAGQIAVVENLAEAATCRVIPTNTGFGAISVRASDDGGSIFAVSSGGSSAFRINLSGYDIQTLDLPERPTRLQWLRTGNTFLFSTPPDGPVWMLIDDAGTMRAVFAAKISAEVPQ